MDNTEFIKLHDFDSSEVDPDAILAQVNTQPPTPTAAGTSSTDETDALLKSLGM